MFLQRRPFAAFRQTLEPVSSLYFYTGRKIFLAPFEMSMYWVSFLVAPYCNVYPFESAALLIVNIKTVFNWSELSLWKMGLLWSAFSADLSGDSGFVERSPCIIEAPESQRVQGLTTDTVSMSGFRMTSALCNASSCHCHSGTVTLF